MDVSPGAQAEIETGHAAGLLERERARAELESALQACVDGEGSVALVEGAAGLGKTRLLQLMRVEAVAAGLRVASGAGGELERGITFNVVRQLFEPWVLRADRRTRGRLLSGAAAAARPLFPGTEKDPPARAAPDTTGMVLHGLYWLTANLAEQAPLLMVVDDAHWLDEPSLHWLAYLARRIAELPVLLVLGLRSDEPGAAAIDAVQLAADTRRVPLAPLSLRGTAQLLRRALGEAVPDALCASCHAATGGNPFLLGELTRTLLDTGTTSVEASSTAVDALRPEGVARFARSRLNRLGDDAAGLAEAVAVLGDGVPLRHAAAVAKLDPDAAVRSADALVGAQLLTPAPLGFVHPLIRTAVYAEMPPAARAEAHAVAARLLAADRAEPSTVASHLLKAEPAGRPETVELLRHAAREAVAAGAPAMACAYLRRGLAEPPDDSLRGGLVRALGSAELLAREPQATKHLEQALRVEDAPRERAAIALELGRGLLARGALAQAEDVLRDGAAAAAGSGSDLLVRIEAHRVAIGVWDPGFAVGLRQRLPALRGLARRPAGRPLALALAFYEVFASSRPTVVLGLVEHGLEGAFTGAGQPDGLILTFAARALTLIDELERAERMLDAMARAAASRGSVMNYAAACAWRAGVALRRGAIRVAEAEARRAVDLAVEHDLQVIAPYARTFLAEALLELARPREALAVLDSIVLGALSGTRPEAWILRARAQVAGRVGRLPEAVAHLRAIARLHDTLGFSNPNVLPWRSELALALPASEQDERRALVDQELVEAHSAGLPRGIGVALRTQALVCAGREQAPELLRAAVAELERCPSELELARTQLELGAALRRLGRRREARVPLQLAMDLAHHCHAVAVCDRAREELVACGGRPRRPARSGVDALTPAELRVSKLAAAGCGNREIAELLFVSMRTVATHLGHTYQKLDIASRAELAAMLASSPEHEDPADGADPAPAPPVRAAG